SRSAATGPISLSRRGSGIYELRGRVDEALVTAAVPLMRLAIVMHPDCTPADANSFDPARVDRVLTRVPDGVGSCWRWAPSWC
ncbi:MAG: hypothetical protein ABI190_00955, partial [Casimicrobiaceae bacterium]